MKSQNEQEIQEEEEQEREEETLAPPTPSHDKEHILSPNLQFGPLSLKETKAVAQVTSEYAHFWNHIKFKNGWAVPFFTRDEVEEILVQAAEIVVRIRSHIDKHQNPNDGMIMRMVDGSARDLLFQWDMSEYHPQ